jgi:hypothetical protein
VYIVKLKPNLLEVNARIKAAHARIGVAKASALLSTSLSGTLHNGYNQATAQIAPGTCGTITVSFQMVVVSISSSTFDLYRTELQDLLSVSTEQAVAKAAGIATQPPPAAASRMASYVDQLFSDVVFDGATVSDQSRTFSDGDCATSACRSMLAATRLLDVTQVGFSGTLTASSESGATAQVAAYVPISAVEFDDGLTIPFAGYSDNVLVDDGGLKPLDIPDEFWAELAGGGLGAGAA